MKSTAYILTLSLFFLISCASQKQKTTKETNTVTSTKSDSSAVINQEINSDWIQQDNTLTKKDGTVEIEFEGTTKVIVLPDNQIQAFGQNPKIKTNNQLIEQKEIKETGNTSQRIGMKIDHTKHQDSDISQVESSKEKESKPSLVPWIGAGLAIAIVVLAVLFYFFRMR